MELARSIWEAYGKMAGERQWGAMEGSVALEGNATRLAALQCQAQYDDMLLSNLVQEALVFSRLSKGGEGQVRGSATGTQYEANISRCQAAQPRFSDPDPPRA